MTHVLVARQDNAGDVLLAGPAVRAVAAGAERVTLLCGPAGAEAARLLPGVDEVVVVGDIGADVEAAQAAGGRGILVPNEATDPAEVEAAPARAATLLEAVDRILQDAP